MKTKLLLVLILLYSNFSYSQQFQESLDWLNSKKLESFGFFSYQVDEESSNSLKFKADSITLNHSSNQSYTRLSWQRINDLRINDEEEGKHTLWIVSNNIFQGLPLYVAMKFSTKDLRDRFSKAITHVVQLKGGVIFNNLDYDYSKKTAVDILRARLIDVYEGDQKLRLEITEDLIKEYYLNSTYTKEIYWKNVKEIKYSVFESNKKYWKISIIGSADSQGNIPQIYFYIFHAVAKNYVDALSSLATQNGATLLKEDLF